MIAETSVRGNVEDLECSAVGSSRYLPASVLSVVRMGLGIHLLVNGVMMLSTQPELVEFYRWERYLFVTPLCGVSLILLALCSAMEGAVFAPIVTLCEVATGLHMVGGSFALATLTIGVRYCHMHALVYILLDFALGARLRFRYIDMGFPLVVLGPVLWGQSMQSVFTVGELAAVIVGSVLMLAISHALNSDASSEKANLKLPEPMPTTYEAI